MTFKQIFGDNLQITPFKNVWPPLPPRVEPTFQPLPAEDLETNPSSEEAVNTLMKIMQVGVVLVGNDGFFWSRFPI